MNDFEEDIIYAITLQHKHKWGFHKLIIICMTSLGLWKLPTTDFYLCKYFLCTYPKKNEHHATTSRSMHDVCVCNVMLWTYPAICISNGRRNVLYYLHFDTQCISCDLQEYFIIIKYKANCNRIYHTYYLLGILINYEWLM